MRLEDSIHHGSEVTQSHQPQQSRSSATSSPTEGRNQISVPQKRGVNPLLYNDLDYSGNSIPHGGLWDDINGPPLASSSSAGRLPLAALFPDPGSDSQMRNYDLLASLLGPPPAQTFYGDPITPSVNYPYVYGLGYGDRSKRMASSSERNPPQSLRLKRSPSKLTPADALSLLALLESRDPYPAMSGYFPLVPANGPNDVLPYSPNSVYQDIPLSLALAQLGGGGGGGGSLHTSRNVAQLAPYSDDEGEWMNTWTEPAVDYLGFPMDVDTLSRLDHRDTKPSKNGFPHQKRFMIAKKKRSVSFNDNDDCNKNENKKSCLLRKYGQLAAAKVATA
ncbi:uncharacterized protein LOC135706610 [Ochlerotatus camptorhynchus]|uniref:uncharacterized protein LOC135706610 n=1 Tax=Ochlerotatus camptorhynchus TaxID=644619 RepID=UPI0031D4E41A